MAEAVATQIAFEPDESWLSDVRLYQLNPPFQHVVDHVVVSAVHADDAGPEETVVLPSTEDGQVLAWVNLPGSPIDAFDHAAALKAVGYDVHPLAARS